MATYIKVPAIRMNLVLRAPHMKPAIKLAGWTGLPDLAGAWRFQE